MFRSLSCVYSKSKCAFSLYSKIRAIQNMGNENSLLNTLEKNLTSCRIVVVGPKNGDDCLVELVNLPQEAHIIATGSNVEELRKDGNMFTEGNVLLNISGNASILSEIIDEMPFLIWVHSITAGVDHILCPALVNNEDITLTNAKGVFSSSLAEYVMLACSYFAKDIARMKRQQEAAVWDKFMVTELRGRTMGIVGYGNIGLHCAKLAKAYGMKVLALRRNPVYSSHDRHVDQALSTQQLDELMQQSDFVVVCMALTPETKGYIDMKHLKMAKKGQVFINIGRGALVDEQALITCLQDGTLAGAALDVFTIEPLPADSPLWKMPNVLLSPHNADLTSDSRQSSVRYFTSLCAKFIAGEELDSVVDKTAGY